MGNIISPTADVLRLPLQERAEMALKAAVQEVINDHVREGLPFYIWRDGRVVELSMQELRALSSHSASE
jgi:hypothetical protein